MALWRTGMRRWSKWWECIDLAAFVSGTTRSACFPLWLTIWCHGTCSSAPTCPSQTRRGQHLCSNRLRRTWHKLSCPSPLPWNFWWLVQWRHQRWPSQGSPTHSRSQSCCLLHFHPNPVRAPLSQTQSCWFWSFWVAPDRPSRVDRARAWGPLGRVLGFSKGFWRKKWNCSRLDFLASVRRIYSEFKRWCRLLTIQFGPGLFGFLLIDMGQLLPKTGNGSLGAWQLLVRVLHYGVVMVSRAWGLPRVLAVGLLFAHVPYFPLLPRRDPSL